MLGLWESSLRSIESRIKPHNFEMWIKPIRLLSVDEKMLRLRAPNRFIQEWFVDNYLPLVLEEVQNLAGRPYEGVVELGEEPPVEAAAAPEEPPVPIAATPPPPLPVVPLSAGERFLQRKYSFDRFIVGPSNQLAHAASRAVAELPADKYNPLFIYGGVGLGKTHLLCAIGQALSSRRPGLRVLYIAAEAYMNEYITSVRNGRIEDFRAKFRDGCDVLLMDDIQFIAGKDRTQEEFFHTFNSLYESHKQMVFTADRFPHEIDNLEDRIRSRFQWGLIADIQPPEFETRIAILEKWADDGGIAMSKDVATFLASNVKTNIRELEGLLTRVAAFASVRGEAITIEVTREALKHFLTQVSQSVTVDIVQREVAAYFTLKVADLKSEKRHQLVARPRQIAMYLARKICKCSYPELGQRFGGKDHTTVLSACRKIEQLVASDPKTRYAVEHLERLLTQ